MILVKSTNVDESPRYEVFDHDEFISPRKMDKKGYQKTQYQPVRDETALRRNQECEPRP